MKQKINIRLLAIAILGILTTTICVTVIYYSLFVKQVKNDLVTSAQLLRDTHYFAKNDNNDAKVDIKSGDEELRITWIDSDGTVLYDNEYEAKTLPNHADRPEVCEALNDGEGETVRKSDTQNMNTFYYALLLEDGTVLRVALDAENIQTMFFKAMPMILCIILLILIVCALLSHMLTKQLITPIEAMASSIEDTSKEPPYKELMPFANMIRKQHADILSAARVRQDFTANVSHELKTPLTAISGYAELIENKMVDEERQEHFIKEIRKNSDRLLTLIDDIIKLSELDQSGTKPRFEELDIYDVAAEAVETLKVTAMKKNIHVSLSGESCKLMGSKDMIREIIDNLVQNAIRYNNEGGNVRVCVGTVNGEKLLCVEDDGIGISKEDQERVFERFYRVDKSRSRETGGTGLGLAIVKHIVELHDARLELDSELGKGTIIKIWF